MCLLRLILEPTQALCGLKVIFILRITPLHTAALGPLAGALTTIGDSHLIPTP